MTDIVLATINARYIHASLGLRYLYANMAELRSRTRLQEFTLQQRADEIVERLLTPETRIIGFGVYIWNVSETTDVLRLLKVLRPDITLVVGGPEVSHEIDQQRICQLAHHVITGAADIAFAELCRQLDRDEQPGRLVSSLPLSLNSLVPPYPYYSDDDIAHRVIYVEASRGCPFKCEFCLSSLDRTAVAFELPAFLQQMQRLIDRGARRFKFVDRTFNLKSETSREILTFFLGQMNKGLFLHFELIPDRLPPVLLELLPQFPENSLQFEIGIQSFNPEVQQRISRRQQHQLTCENLQWLRENTRAHVHADLIFGLPGENLDSFGRGFDLLYSLGPQEIQVGILKRLRGTPIARHTAEYDLRFMSTPPYRILAHRDADFATVQRVVRFARYWDLLGNSGRFPNTLPLLLAGTPFERFMQLSDWLHATTAQTHRVALSRLFGLLHEYQVSELHSDRVAVELALTEDHLHNGLKGQPAFARRSTSEWPAGQKQATSLRSGNVSSHRESSTLIQRQRRHR